MPLKTHQPEEPSLNLTPMIDIVLLLVIFFMVGTQFTEAERQYEIDLPTVSTAQPLTALPDEIVINVDKEGTLFVNGDSLSMDELRRKLRAAHERYADQSVVIRGDGELNYQRIMDVLNMCQQVNINHLHLANRLKEGAAP